MTSDEYSSLSDAQKVEVLEQAYVDALNGNDRWFDILNSTGLEPERCVFMAELYQVVESK